MTDLAKLYGTQLDELKEAEKANKPVGGCHIVDILQEYYHRLGLEMDGSGAVTVTQKCDPTWQIVVLIKLDGYQVEFNHHPTFEIPPRQCWQKIDGEVTGLFEGVWPAKEPDYFWRKL